MSLSNDKNSVSELGLSLSTQESLKVPPPINAKKNLPEGYTKVYFNTDLIPDQEPVVLGRIRQRRPTFIKVKPLVFDQSSFCKRNVKSFEKSDNSESSNKENIKEKKRFEKVVFNKNLIRNLI
jgi:hypothetical protein